ncbi:PilC/PilY family type IV pilus protein [uncultured Marinobacter sp.]|uniref:pilus assembly protein n=1 Tax=uncultured Marinobacter sp. TaxID=187379 RepID=UPI0030C7C914
MDYQTIYSRAGHAFTGLVAAAALAVAYVSPANATVAQTPLFLTQGVEPQVMLSLSNDHQLFFEAYPDYLDLDGNGQADQTYIHANDYYGYFDSYKCYNYDTNTSRYTPEAITADKYCDSVSGNWSGNFLNYLTTSRMDVVRKILFGGFRRIDTDALTVLERAYIPTDGHSWVRYYNGSDLNRLSPFSSPDEIVSTSSSTLTVETGSKTITLDTNRSEFFDSVENGDQILAFQGVATGITRPDIANPGSTPLMLGRITAIDSGNNRITMQVQGVNRSGFDFAGWTVVNLSRSGVTFCNTTNNSSLSDGERVPVNKPPRMSVASGNYSLWNANERYQCRWSNEVSGSQGVNGNNVGVSEFAANSRSPDRGDVGLGEKDYIVRVEVCDPDLIHKERCKQYPEGNYKPVGLLQQYGDDEGILFGLLSGSYERNKSGGVLRKNVSEFSDEVNVGTDGTFTTPPSLGNIVDTLNVLRMYGYGTNGVYTRDDENCSFQLNSFPDGRCVGWGNPQSEIFLEAVRYFTGSNPTPAFTQNVGTTDQLTGLNVQTWNDTLSTDNYCAPLNIINFNGSVASYDRDQLDSVSDIPGLTGVESLRSIVDEIGASEGINGNNWFIGENDTVTNQLCTSKTLSSLADAVGLCPEAPRLSGGFDAAGLAHHAYTEDLRPGLQGDQNIKTFAVALAPAVPRIDIPLPGTSDTAVTILPACRNASIGGNCAIVDFKVVRQDLTNGTGKFLVNWEDSEQGGDYDQDMWGVIDYTITDSALTVTTRTGAESTTGRLGFGYVLSGTTKDGFHAHSGIEGFSYTDPTGVTGCNNCQVNDAATSVTYTLNSGGASDGLLQNPMLYAAKWGGYDKQANFPSDPESWDANNDGLPDNYYFAIDPSKLATDLELVFADILRSSSAAASVAASSSSLSTDTAVYQASFNSENWSGDLRAFSIESDGSVAEIFDWSAGTELDNLTPGEVEARNIITNDDVSTDGQVDGELLSTTGKQFLWDNLQPDQKLALRQNLDGTQTDVDTGALRVEYLRGDRSEEQTLTNPGGIFRERDSRLGDIINSNPQYVFRQNFGYAGLSDISAFSTVPDYNTFRASSVYQSRPPVVVVGANDGMLHGFNASSGVDAGKELFAYVPSDIMGNLAELTQNGYTHRYYVDGSPRVADAYLGSTLGWRTMAVGSTGAGGESIFALDITDPENVTENQFLWEFSHPDMGRTLQQPSIVPMPNGEFAVIVSSGFSDSATDGGGKVWVLNAATGRPIRTFDFPDSGQFGSPLAVDLTNDRVVDRIYVGDSEGNLWRIDTEGTNASQWDVPNALQQGQNLFPLFTAPSGQPITAPLASAFNVKGEHMVFFGTGTFLRQGDNVIGVNPEIQAFYGIIDDNDSPETLDVSDLLEQEILTRVDQVERTDENGNSIVIDVGLTFVSNNQISSERGWYMDLVWESGNGGPGPQGERVTSRALVRGDRVIFTSLIPSSDACSAGGTSWLYELSTLSGSRLDYSVFDINNDGKFDEGDFVTITVDGQEFTVPPSGLDPDIGIITTPTVLTDPVSGNERKIFTGSSGQIISVPEAGSINRGRQNWEQIR